MSLSNRRNLLFSLAALPLALSGCGFEPVYKQGGVADGLRGSILVDAPDDRDEYLLNVQLETRLGRAEAPRYGLSVVLNTREEGLAVSGSNDITRYNVLGDATFVLRDLATGASVLTDKVNTFTSYSASQQPVATLAASRDAKARLMIALADKIVAILLIRAGQL